METMFFANLPLIAVLVFIAALGLVVLAARLIWREWFKKPPHKPPFTLKNPPGAIPLQGPNKDPEAILRDLRSVPEDRSNDDIIKALMASEPITPEPSGAVTLKALSKETLETRLTEGGSRDVPPALTEREIIIIKAGKLRAVFTRDSLQTDTQKSAYVEALKAVAQKDGTWKILERSLGNTEEEPEDRLLSEFPSTLKEGEITIITTRDEQFSFGAKDLKTPAGRVAHIKALQRMMMAGGTWQIIEKEVEITDHFCDIDVEPNEPEVPSEEPPRSPDLAKSSDHPSFAAIPFETGRTIFGGPQDAPPTLEENEILVVKTLLRVYYIPSQTMNDAELRGTCTKFIRDALSWRVVVPTPKEGTRGMFRFAPSRPKEVRVTGDHPLIPQRTETTTRDTLTFHRDALMALKEAQGHQREEE